MKFREFPLGQAENAIVAHLIRGASRSYKKGHKLSAIDLEDIQKAGVEQVLAAHLEDGDLDEDAAATEVARALAGIGVRVAPAFTGRANLFAEDAGLVRFDAHALDVLNGLDERITVASLRPLDAVSDGQMVATVKIIPFSVPERTVTAARECAGQARLEVSAFQPLKVSLIQTRLPGTPEKILDKTVRVTEDRLASLSLRLVSEKRCAHNRSELAAEIASAIEGSPDLLLVAGASAITDRADILPRAIVDAGGRIDYFGMPVDPGNLLLLARLADTPVLGMPGCARSPKLNGFDWVLQRIAAGMEIAPKDIQAMGVGGLLSEIPSRPQPRRQRPSEFPAARVAGLVLAAGQSRRMGPRNKLSIEIQGKPMVRHAVDALAGAGLSPILAVSGHEPEKLALSLSGSSTDIVHNPDFAQGLATSLKCGIDRLKGKVDAAVIALGDMPLVDASLIRRLVAAFDPTANRSIVVPTFNGKRGNPVLWSARYFDEMAKLEGDVGAKHLIGLFAEEVFEVECPDDASLTDLDTPEAIARFEAAQ